VRQRPRTPATSRKAPCCPGILPGCAAGAKNEMAREDDSMLKTPKAPAVPAGIHRCDLTGSRFPVVESFRVTLSAAQIRQLSKLAQSLLDDDPKLLLTPNLGARVDCGLATGPTLLIEDHSQIQLFERQFDQPYAYRALWLAQEGDLMVVHPPANADFERYAEQTLGIGRLETLLPAARPPGASLTGSCLRDDALIERVVARAREAGTLTVLPYMGTGGVWALASAIADRARVPVRVAAPAPGLSRRVNDKLWFANLISAVVGRAAKPVTRAAYGSARLAAEVASLARRHPTIAVKLTDSASSKGNFVLQASDLARLSLQQLRQRLLRRMRAAGWRGQFPVMVSAWEKPVIVSPSVHLWIPGLEQGKPIVEAIFDQRLLGENDEFAGAAPTTLPDDWQLHLAREATMFGVVFQLLGYFGRCSFDAIVIGEDLSAARLHWIECNGRWGGVSLPLTLANRLFGDWRKQPLVIEEREHLEGKARPFGEILSALEGLLYVAGGAPTGAIIFAPSAIERGNGFEIMAFDEDVERAAARARVVSHRIGRLLAVSPPG